MPILHFAPWKMLYRSLRTGIFRASGTRLAGIPVVKRREGGGKHKKETCRESRQVSYTLYGIQ